MGLLDEYISEEDFQQTIIELAQRLGWKVAHFRAARGPVTAQNPRGWATPVGADGAGFPDLVLVRERVIYVEVKKQKGKTQDNQKVWLGRLRAAGAEVYLWRPSDYDEAERVLGQRSAE